MSADDQVNRAGDHPDPFALPAETTFRFVLLVLATLAAGLFVANWVFYSVGEPDISAQVVCVESLQSQIAAGQDPAKANASLAECHDYAHRTGFATIIGAVAIFALGGLAAALAPAVRTRLRRLGPLEDDVPDAADAIAELAREAGLTRLPEPVWNPLDPGTSALAFGAFGRYRIALGAGLVALCFSDPERFRSVIRHELAHMRNGDVTLTYMAVFVWWAFVVAGVVPFALTLFDEPLDTVFDVGWRLAALAALLYVSRNAVLRGREAYADARAVSWDRSIDPLKDALRTSSASRQSWPGVIRRLTAVHPSTTRRIDLLERPQGLFRVQPLDALAAGVAAGVVFWQLASAIGLIAQGRDPDVLAPTWAALGSVPLAVGVVVAGIWRMSLLSGKSESSTASGPFGAGLALAAGLLIGGLISLEEAIPLGLGLGYSGYDLLWAATLALAGVGFSAWARAAAGAWLGAVDGARIARVALAACWIVGGAALAWFIGQAKPMLDLLEVPQSPGIRAIVNSIAVKDVTYAAFAALALFPLLPYLSRQRPRPIHLRGNAIAAIAGAGAFLLTAMAWRLIAHATVSLAERDTDEYLLAYAHRHEEIAVGLQAAVACFVVFRRGLLAIPAGLLASLLTGVLSALAFVGLITGASCIAPLALTGQSDCPSFVELSFVWDTTVQWGSEGAMLAAVAMPLALLVRWLSGRVPAPQSDTAAAGLSGSGEKPVLRAMPRPALSILAAGFAAVAIAASVGYVALAQSSGPDVRAIEQPATDPRDAGDPQWLAEVRSLCDEAQVDIDAAAGAPREITLSATAERLRLLAASLEAVSAPPAETTAIQNAATLLGASVRSLNEAAQSAAAGDELGSRIQALAATEGALGANRFLDLATGAGCFTLDL